jgi:hypothetical protein
MVKQDEACEAAMSRVRVMHAFDIFELMEMIQSISQTFAMEVVLCVLSWCGFLN